MDKASIRYYMEGACPSFAIALHRLTGLPLFMLVDEAAIEKWNGEEFPVVAHVFVMTPDRSVIDASGIRHLSEVIDHYHDLADPQVHQLGLQELKKWMGEERPLCEYDPGEIQEAIQLIRRDPRFLRLLRK